MTLNDHRLAVNTPDSEWTWVRVGDQPLELTAGKVTITLETEDHAAQLDVLCLANNSDFQPIGPRPEDTTPPPTPTRLRVENVRERVNRLTWQGPQDPRHSHYHVYASPEAEPAVDQTTRIGSPTEEEMIDWGLRAGTTYHYAVTAVDRRGNESAPARATLTTPPRGAPPFERQLAFADADLAGPFEQAEAGGLRAETYVVPEDPATNRATWQVQIPHQGTYYLWLRHLLRGKGGRGQSVRQNVQVRANGRHVATLGGGRPDLNVPDRLIAEGNPLAAQLWTWVWPGEADLDRVELPAGEVEIELSNLAPDIRYDVLVITDEPAFVPRDGRLRQR